MKSFLLYAALVAATAPALCAQSQTEAIQKYAAAGNAAGLQSLRTLSPPLAGDERLIITALLEQDGEVAKALYEQALVQFPNSSLAALCKRRLDEYKAALNATALAAPPVAVTPTPVNPPIVPPKPAPVVPLAPVATAPKPSPAPSPVPPPKPAVAPAGFTLQFGSFGSRDNAQRRTEELKNVASTKIIEVKEPSGATLYKVRLNGGFRTREEVDAYAKKLPKLSTEPFIVEY